MRQTHKREREREKIRRCTSEAAFEGKRERERERILLQAFVLTRKGGVEAI